MNNDSLNSESTGQHIIFIVILLHILFFTYCAIPSHEEKKNKDIIPQKQGELAIFESPEKQLPIEEAVEKKPFADKSIPEDKTGKALPITVPDKPPLSLKVLSIIPMDNPGYTTHKKGIVQFTHQKHAIEYAIDCGSCHHDEKGMPLKLTDKDPVQSCIECHKETEKPKGEKLDKKQKIAKYHFEALHANCIGCHKADNKKKGDPKGKGPAPTSCKDCHPKTK